MKEAVLRTGLLLFVSLGLGFRDLGLGFRVQGSGLLIRNLIEVTILGKPY